MNVVAKLAQLFRASPGGCLFVAALFVRILILSRFAASSHFLPETDDMRFYADWAHRIMQGKLTDGQAFYGLPGYAYCLAGIFSVFGFNPFIVGLIQVIFEALTTVLIFKIAKAALSFSQERTIPRPASSLATTAAALAALGWIFYQPAQTFSTILMPTAWVVVAFWGCVWGILQTRESSPWWPWLGLGLFVGVVSMMVATILFLLPLFLVGIVFSITPDRPWRARTPRIALAVVLLFAGTLLGAAPATLHNYLIAKDPVMLSAHSGLNFWMGNNPEATGYPKIPEGLSASQEGLLRDSITRAEEAAGRKLKRSEVSKFWSAKADAWVRENRGAWFALIGVKLRNFWNAFQYDDLSEINLLRDEGILPPGLRFGLVAAFGLPGLVIAAWRFPRARWVAAAVLLHMAALLPVFITERYRLCAVPGLMIFAAFLIVEIWRLLATARWLAVGATLAALGASVWFVSLPQRAPGLWALDPFNTGLKELRTGNLDLAQQKLETAHTLVPDNAEINFALGNLWYARRDPARARQFYERTLELAARHTGACNNLARLDMDAGNWSAAETSLRRSLAIDPESAKVYYMLAETRLQAGDRAAARVAIGEALRRDPERPAFRQFRDHLDQLKAP